MSASEWSGEWNFGFEAAGQVVSMGTRQHHEMIQPTHRRKLGNWEEIPKRVPERTITDEGMCPTMSDDIVTRLRHKAEAAHRLMAEAADEIERLRAIGRTPDE